MSQRSKDIEEAKEKARGEFQKKYGHLLRTREYMLTGEQVTALTAKGVRIEPIDSHYATDGAGFAKTGFGHEAHHVLSDIRPWALKRLLNPAAEESPVTLSYTINTEERTYHGAKEWGLFTATGVPSNVLEVPAGPPHFSFTCGGAIRPTSRPTDFAKFDVGLMLSTMGIRGTKDSAGNLHIDSVSALKQCGDCGGEGGITAGHDGESFPCPTCNTKEYRQWLLIQHPPTPKELDVVRLFEGMEGENGRVIPENAEGTVVHVTRTEGGAVSAYIVEFEFLHEPPVQATVYRDQCRVTHEAGVDFPVTLEQQETGDMERTSGPVAECAATIKQALEGRARLYVDVSPPNVGYFLILADDQGNRLLWDSTEIDKELLPELGDVHDTIANILHGFGMVLSMRSSKYFSDVHLPVVFNINTSEFCYLYEQVERVAGTGFVEVAEEFKRILGDHRLYVMSPQMGDIVTLADPTGEHTAYWGDKSQLNRMPKTSRDVFRSLVSLLSKHDVTIVAEPSPIDGVLVPTLVYSGMGAYIEPEPKYPDVLIGDLLHVDHTSSMVSTVFDNGTVEVTVGHSMSAVTRVMPSGVVRRMVWGNISNRQRGAGVPTPATTCSACGSEDLPWHRPGCGALKDSTNREWVERFTGPVAECADKVNAVLAGRASLHVFTDERSTSIQLLFNGHRLVWELEDWPRWANLPLEMKEVRDAVRKVLEEYGMVLAVHQDPEYANPYRPVVIEPASLEFSYVNKKFATKWACSGCEGETHGPNQPNGSCASCGSTDFVKKGRVPVE